MMIYILGLLLILLVGVLILGLTGFARNSEFYNRNANRLMRWRLLIQFAAVIVAFLILAISKK